MLIINITAIFTFILRLDQVPLLQLLPKNALSIIFHLHVSTVLNGKCVLWIQIVNNILIDTSVLLNVSFIKVFVSLNYVLIEAVLLRLKIILNFHRRLEPSDECFDCDHFDVSHA